MSDLLVDTNMYSALAKGQRNVIDRLADAKSLALCPIIVGELLYGFKAGSREEKNRAVLSSFLSKPGVSMVLVTNNTPEFYSDICRDLRKKGRMIPSNDIWIAACAIENGLTLISFDAHFRNVSGLDLEVPSP